MLTLEQFKRLPLTYVKGISAEKWAHRAYRNEVYRLQVEVLTKRKRGGEWGDGVSYWYLDGDPREFTTAEACYAAWLERQATATPPPHPSRPSKRLDTWERVRRAQKRADARIAAHGRWAPQAVRAVNAYRAALQRVPTDSA